MSELSILLKNYIEPSEPMVDSDWIDIVDAISQNAVFFDEINPKDHAMVYVKSSNNALDTNFQTILNNAKIGPQTNILLTGYIGTGKSTTLRFLADEIKSSKKCNCANAENCPLTRPLVIYKTFQNEQLDEDEISIRESKERFIESMNNFLLAAITNKNNFKEVELFEIRDFWNYSIKLADENYFLNPAFNWIISNLGENRDNLNKRKAVLKELKMKRGDNLLIYLLSFLGFISREILKDDHNCIIVIIDDLDHASLVTQAAIIETISRFNHHNATDPQLLIAIRPESSAGRNFGTIFLDKVTHISPDPSKVLLKRIQYALDNYDNVSRLFEKSHITTADSQLFYDYLQKLLKIISENSSLQKFLKSISNGSARLAIYAGDGLLKVSRSIMRKEISLYDLIHASITRGKGYYKPLSQNQHPIKNIYSMRGVDTPKHIFLKLRILKILKKDRKLGLIRLILNKFEYSPEMQLTALNELLEKPWSLVFSSGCEKYKSLTHYLEAATDDLRRTELGIGYGKELWVKMYYCQEMMFDCWVFKNRFDEIIDKVSNKINDSTLLERLKIYHNFLQCMIDQETEDIKLYLAGCNSIKEYSMYFDEELYSYRIIKDASYRVARIYNREGTWRSDKWETMIKAYTDLENWAYHQNQIIFTTN